MPTPVTIASGSTVPTGITRLEELVIWAISAQKHMTQDQTCLINLPGGGQSRELVLSTSIFTDADGVVRFGFTGYLPIDPSYITDKTTKFWIKAKDTVDGTIPSAYTTN